MEQDAYLNTLQMLKDGKLNASYLENQKEQPLEGFLDNYFIVNVDDEKNLESYDGDKQNLKIEKIVIYLKEID